MGTCATPLRSSVRARQNELKAASAAAGADYLNVLPWFCDKKHTCPIVVRDIIVYRDADHVTQTYAERLKPVLARFLRF
jgi:hypothetical protein